MNRRSFVITLLVAALTLSAAVALAAEKKWPRGGTLGTATVGGSFYLWGVGFSNLLKEKLPQYQLSLEVTGGGTHNLQLVENGGADFGQAYVSGQYDALNGLGWAKGKKHLQVRSVLPTSLNLWVSWAPTKTGITKLKDLQGKVVHLANKGGNPDSYARQWFDALGIKPAKLVNSNLSEQVSQMTDGLIDAAIGNGNSPYGPPMEVEAHIPLNILVFEPDDIAKIRAIQPYFSQAKIKGGVYKSATATQDMDTLASWVYLICGKDAPEDLVYTITKIYYENLEIMDKVYKGTSDLKPEDIVHSIMPIHKGAARYYKERGVTIPKELLVD